MHPGPVVLEVDGRLARITLNRPEVLNAENLAWVEGLEAAVTEVAARPECLASPELKATMDAWRQRRAEQRG